MAKFFFHSTWHAIDREPEASFSCFIKNKGPGGEKNLNERRDNTIYASFKEWAHSLTKEGNINIFLSQNDKCKNLWTENSKVLDKIFNILNVTISYNTGNDVGIPNGFPSIKKMVLKLLAVYILITMSPCTSI